MKEITEDDARRLILGGKAGYWGIHQRSVLMRHEKQHVLRLRGKCWLADNSEFKMEYAGYVGILGGRHKGAYTVNCIDPEIVRMAQEEMAERGMSPISKKD